ncbi:hypothetical protein Tco_1481251 [Tanacetum coccineum]
MESSSSNSEEMELQQMQLNERELHKKCLTWFTKLKIHLETLHNSFHYMKTRSFEIAFRIFFLEEATALDFHNKSWQESFAEGTRCKPDNFRSLVLLYMEELDKIIDERVLKNEEVRMKEKEVQAIKEIEKRLKESELQHQESLVIEGTTLEANLCTDNTVIEACLVTEGETLEACLVKEGIALNDNTGVTENSGTESKGILNLR